MKLCPHMIERTKGWEHPPTAASCWECLPLPDHYEKPERKRKRLREQSKARRKRFNNDYHSEATHLSPYVN